MSYICLFFYTLELTLTACFVGRPMLQQNMAPREKALESLWNKGNERK